MSVKSKTIVSHRAPSDIMITRIDETSTPGVTYIGKALPGADPAQPVWQIQAITDTLIGYANSDPMWDKVWNSRTTYPYG